MEVFTRFVRVSVPAALEAEAASQKNPAFDIEIVADGEIPFPQILFFTQGREHILGGTAIQLRHLSQGEVAYLAKVPSGLFGPGEVRVQVEGCRQAEWRRAGGDDWIKEFRTLHLRAAAEQARLTGGFSAVGGFRGPVDGVKVYFGIHKHMHQPYYDAADRNAWDGEKDGIFGSRAGNYSSYIPRAIRHYAEGGLAHAGLSTSWSGSLIEQLHRAARDGLAGGRFSGWNHELRALASQRTTLGHQRCDFTAFGFYHPLMPLIPARNIVKQIAWHRGIVREAFGVDPSRVMFPPETAFHVRMIPALLEAGVDVIIYDSIHRYRACRDYPYAGKNEGMLPPNRAEQTNASVADWLQLQNVWAGSKISPSLLKPEYVAYEDPEGGIHKMICVPAERYIGNEDARGGFGALQYPTVLGQVYDQIVAHGTFDPKHPPFFLLHSDGDNHGGGADSYYHHNTERLVEWLRQDPRFELTTVLDYLERFPPDSGKVVHIEPGSWSGADNGDPQFMKWFSRYRERYSPDLNSWAVLTALQNMVHSVEDAEPNHAALSDVVRLMLTAETSCYWYWTGQHVWDQQVTRAANAAHDRIKDAVGEIARRKDRTAPTIFPPWVIPENPGGQTWSHDGLCAAPREGMLHAFVYDVAGLARVDLVLRVGGREQRIAMTNHGPYPSETGARVVAHHFTASLPVGAGDVRYYVEAEDGCGNIARGSLERIFLA